MSQLLALRIKLNLTQEELAARAGLSVRTIQRIEAGVSPRGYTLKALAKALAVSENELLPQAPPAPPLDLSLLKFINFASLPGTLLPPLNIVLPLIVMLAKKQVNPITRQLISIQIIWIIVAAIIFFLGIFIRKWLGLENAFTPLLLLFLFLCNSFIILRNAFALDKKQELAIKLKFNIV